MRKIITLLFIFLLLSFLWFKLTTFGGGSASRSEKSEKAQTMIVSLKAREEPTPAPAEEQTQMASAPEIHSAAPTTDAEISDQTLIPIHADYSTYLGFQEYAQSMIHAGGRFYIYDPEEVRILAEVDPVTGTFAGVHRPTLRGMGTRIREMSGELSVIQLTRKAANSYQIPQATMILLMPKGFDASLTQQLREEIRKSGAAVNSLLGAEGIYRKHGGSTVLQIHQLRTDTGLKAVNISIRIS